MGLPFKLKNFNVFSDGYSWLGQAAEIQLPKITLKTEQWRGGGMLGEVDVPMGLEKLEMETKIGGLAVDLMRTMGTIGVDGSMLRYVGAYQEDVAGGVKSAELVVRGLHTEFDPGTGKTGESTEQTVKSTLSYLKWTIAGRVEVEIDQVNCVFMVDGVDRMAQIRAAMGL